MKLQAGEGTCPLKKKQILLQARANTWWEKGIFQCLNPNQTQIEQVINRWLPGIYYNRGKGNKRSS